MSRRYLVSVEFINAYPAHSYDEAIDKALQEIIRAAKDGVFKKPVFYRKVRERYPRQVEFAAGEFGLVITVR